MTVEPCSHPSATEVVRLWDGRDHCRACVESACPGLWEFAQGRDCLEDAIPYDQAGGLQVWWSYAGLMFGCLALVGVGFVAVMELKGFLLLMTAMGVPLLLGALVNLTSVFKARKLMPTVRVRDGVVEVFRPFASRGERPMVTYRLVDARWHVGRLNEDSFARSRGGAIVPRRSAMILRTPRKWPGSAPQSEFTATGSTPEMIRLWKGFLRLAGVVEGK